jgi:hypothetical protein
MVFISYLVGAMALAFPLANALQNNSPHSFLLFGVNFTLTSVVMFGAWIVGGYLASNTPATTLWAAFLQACGMPGLILAVLKVGTL